MKIHWFRILVFYVVTLPVAVILGLDGFWNGVLMGAVGLSVAYLLDKPLFEVKE